MFDVHCTMYIVHYGTYTVQYGIIAVVRRTYRTYRMAYNVRTSYIVLQYSHIVQRGDGYESRI